MLCHARLKSRSGAASAFTLEIAFSRTTSAVLFALYCKGGIQEAARALSSIGIQRNRRFPIRAPIANRRRETERERADFVRSNFCFVFCFFLATTRAADRESIRQSIMPNSPRARPARVTLDWNFKRIGIVADEARRENSFACHEAFSVW